MTSFVIKGDIAFTPHKDRLESYPDSYIIIIDGKVLEIRRDLEKSYSNLPLMDFTGKLIIPGFVDLHLHAPQYPNMGLGMDKELIPWLNSYTFPEEAKYENLEYAQLVFERLIKDLWRMGTTRAAVYSSVHKEASKLLLDMFIESGLGAYVGKVNMDRNTSAYLREETRDSLSDTEEIIREYKNKSDLVKPIITPRFIPTCTDGLLEDLGQMAIKYKTPVQSHLNENQDEVLWVKELSPESRNYASLYNSYNLFGQSKTIMAHCIYSKDEEIELMARNGVYAAHCPYSNYNLASGIMPVRKYLDYGVPVGLGSDIAGGNVLSMARVIGRTIQASKILWLNSDKKLDFLTFSEGFYLGTKGGGSFFGKLGSFEEGYDFDALVIDDSHNINELTLGERLEKYIYTGDDRNILERFVSGRPIKEPFK